MLLRLVLETSDGHVLIRAAGELDVSTSPQLTRTGTDALDDGHTVVLVDLSGITFMDSTGLSALMAVNRVAATRGARVGVVAPSQAVVRILELLGVGDVLTVHDSVEDALRDD